MVQTVKSLKMKLPFYVDVSQSTNRKKKLNSEVLFMLYMYILGDYFSTTRQPILDLKHFPYRDTVSVE